MVKSRRFEMDRDYYMCGRREKYENGSCWERLRRENAWKAYV
jgi:hypothetical protein